MERRGWPRCCSRADERKIVEAIYLGMLPASDPLARFLSDEVLERAIGVGGGLRVFDVYRLHHSGTVLRYADRTTSISVVGKFFGRKAQLAGEQLSREEGIALMQREFDLLQHVRALGFDRPPYRVVRPLGCNPDLDALLVEEFVTGQDLTAVIHAAVHAGQGESLRGRLGDVCGFMTQLHARTRSDEPVDDALALDYLTKLVAQLVGQGVIGSAEQERLHAWRDRWHDSQRLRSATQALIHGDATPANLLFSGDGDVVAIDLERMRRDDPAVDLGCVVAELKHWFLRATGNPWASEWAIRHFYARYRQQLSLSDAALSDLTTRAQFYMGTYLLRISRNAWLDLDYRRRLAWEAEQCLRF